MVKKFPKINSPFNRVEKNDGYYVTDEKNKFCEDWFPENSVAVEKLHGTNGAIVIDGDEVDSVWARHGPADMNEVDPFDSDWPVFQKLQISVLNSFSQNYVNPSEMEDGVHYGEFIGKDFHGNHYEMDENLFIPFSWARKHLRYKSWGEYGQDFDSIEEWFRDGLMSLWYSHYHDVPYDEASVNEGVFCEGVMFHRADWDGRLNWDVDETPQGNIFAKHRRDMYEWYEGPSNH